MDKQDISISHTVFERMALLNRIYLISLISLVLAVVLVILDLQKWMKNGSVEFLILFFINILVIVLSLADYLWSSADYTEKEESPTYSYIHTILSHIAFSTLIAAISSMFQIYQESLWLFIAQAILVFLVGASTMIGCILTQNTQGTKRLTIYITILIGLGISILGAIQYQQVLNSVKINLYYINPLLLKQVKSQIMGSVILLIFAAALNQRRVRSIFLSFGYFVLVFVGVSVFVNGQLSRAIRDATHNINTTEGCRNTMHLISQKSLIEFGCKVKYIHPENSPFPPCPLNQQSFIWESDQPNHTLACLDMNCCALVLRHTILDSRILISCMNILSALLFMTACNVLLLTKNYFQFAELRATGDMLMLSLILVIATGLVVAASTYVPILNWEMKPQLLTVQADEYLKVPNYENFQTQSPLLLEMNENDCKLVKNMLLVLIDTSGYGSLRVAISASRGKFLLKNKLNSKDLQLINDPISLQKVFGTLDANGDYLIFQGLTREIEFLMLNSLFLCYNDPLNVNYQVAQFHINSNRRMLTAVPVTVGTNVAANQQLSSRTSYISVSVVVKSLEDNKYILGATVQLYVGDFTDSMGFLFQSRVTISDLTNMEGRTVLRNLNNGQVYTALVIMNGYKKGVILIDLSNTIPNLVYIIGLTTQIPPHSMRIVMESYSDVNYNLYGIYTAKSTECVVSHMTKQCGGMSFQTFNHLNMKAQFLTIDTIYPYKYLFFVNRALSTQEVTAKLGITQVNQDMMDGAPTLTVYLNEMDYPFMRLKMPLMTSNVVQQLAVNWVSFCLNGLVGDAPILVQKYWSDVTNEDVRLFKGNLKRSWPSTLQCSQS